MPRAGSLFQMKAIIYPNTETEVKVIAEMQIQGFCASHTNHLTHAVLGLFGYFSMLEKRGHFVYLVNKERDVKNVNQTNLIRVL